MNEKIQRSFEGANLTLKMQKDGKGGERRVDWNHPSNKILIESVAGCATVNSNVELISVWGGSPSPLSLRALAHARPPLTIARELTSLDEVSPPIVRIRSAAEISAKYNSPDRRTETLMLDQAKRTQDFLSAYAEEVFPQITLHQDTIDVNEIINDPYFEKDLALLRNLLDTDKKNLSTDLPTAAKAKKVLGDFAIRFGDLDKSLQYAAAHSFAFHDYLSPSEKPTNRIKIGGPAENPFSLIQQYLAEVYHNKGSRTVNSVNSLTLATATLDTGSIPPYYPLVDKDGKICESVIDDPLNNDIQLGPKTAIFTEGYEKLGIKQQNIDQVNKDYYCLTSMQRQDIEFVANYMGKKVLPPIVYL